MAQVTDYVIANGSGSAVRSDINGVFEAVKSSNSGTSAPANAVPGTLWFDTNTSPATLKRRNAANTAWVEVDSDTVPATSVRGNSTGSAAAETNVTMSQLETMLGFTDSIALNGYQKLPSGLIIQWGSQSFGPFTGNAGASVTFATTFPSTAYCIVANADTGNRSLIVTTLNLTTSGADIGLLESAGSSTSGFIRYIVIGV